MIQSRFQRDWIINFLPAARIADALRGSDRSKACFSESFKGIDLLMRAIWHRTEEHVRVRNFICLLPYYVELHMRKAPSPPLFEDEGLGKVRDLVEHGQVSGSAKKKETQRLAPEGSVVQTFDIPLK